MLFRKPCIGKTVHGATKIKHITHLPSPPFQALATKTHISHTPRKI